MTVISHNYRHYLKKMGHGEEMRFAVFFFGV